MEPEHKWRKIIRLKEFDYAGNGAYFVTLCTSGNANLFGEVRNGEMFSNTYGEIVREEWLRSAEIRRELTMDEFIVMPNHFHGIAIFESDEAHCRAQLPRPATNHGIAERRPRSLGSFIAQFKAMTSKRINEVRHSQGCRVWQPNFFERIIRDEDEIGRIRKYIFENPLKWELDYGNPANLWM